MEPYTSPSGTVEVPRIQLEVPIMCTYMKSMLISADFSSMGYALFSVMISQHTIAFFKIVLELLKQLANMHMRKSDKQI